MLRSCYAGESVVAVAPDAVSYFLRFDVSDSGRIDFFFDISC